MSKIEKAVQMLKCMTIWHDLKGDEMNAIKTDVESMEILIKLFKHEPHEMMCVGDILKGGFK